jgi:para-aminobenzoate synthetase/4-amino-4-deoxychorismate lyase
MTSTITGKLKHDTGFEDVIKALFPCGSVTGTPKIRTMEIIADLEKGRRGVYTGAIGFISPQKQAVFSVPIRTLQKTMHNKKWQFRVGGGIVWDSTPGSEWDECMTKSKFISQSSPVFSIVETLLFCKGRFRYLKEHISRMSDSAAYLGFVFNRKSCMEFIRGKGCKLAKSGNFRVRILLNKTGRLSCEHSQIDLPATKQPGILCVSSTKTDSGNPLLFHKTTYRPWYEKAMELAKNGKCLDTVFMNQSGEITECSTNNIFIKKRGMLFTPPVECGLLPGILRANLIKSGKCKEKILHFEDLLNADAVYCGNSVRGLRRVEVRR